MIDVSGNRRSGEKLPAVCCVLVLRVPWGTLLCISYKPLQGEIRLPGQVVTFYEQAIAVHLQIGVTVGGLPKGEGQRLHSHELRAFEEKPCR